MSETPKVGQVWWTFNDKYEAREYLIRNLVWSYPRRGLYASREMAELAAAVRAEEMIRLYQERIIYLRARLDSLTPFKGETEE